MSLQFSVKPCYREICATREGPFCQGQEDRRRTEDEGRQTEDEEIFILIVFHDLLLIMVFCRVLKSPQPTWFSLLHTQNSALEKGPPRNKNEHHFNISNLAKSERQYNKSNKSSKRKAALTRSLKNELDYKLQEILVENERYSLFFALIKHLLYRKRRALKKGPRIPFRGNKQ